MKSLKALSDYLRSLQLTDDDQFDSWAENGTLEPSNSIATVYEQPVQNLLIKRYTAVYSWENFSASADELFGHIITWLNDHDYDYDRLEFPTFDVEILTDDTASVEISIVFEDTVYQDPHADELTLLDEPEVCIAESCELEAELEIIPDQDVLAGHNAHR